ncbi:MAG: cupin domain-containing protein [Candidatus Hodarchaeales archaeon]|jgi:mannose-6-phosphate isomerase-like protein (cupin superfamily)
MFQKRLYELSDLEWKVLRENLTEKVFGKSLIPQDLTNVKIILTKVEPGGEFSLHKDPYHHVFYFITGRGVGWLGNQTYPIQPETIVDVPAGVSHGYKNTGKTDLMLLTVNIPA